MTGSAAQAGRKGGFLANPITVGICLVVASALIIGVAIVAKNKYLGGDRVADTSKALPVDFASSLTPVDSPLVQRAQKVTFDLQSPAAAKVTTIQIWDNGRPYLTLAPKKPGDIRTGYVTSTSFDYVPTTAGQHILSARMTNAAGKVSLPAPFIVPAMDRPEDLYGKAPKVFVDGKSVGSDHVSHFAMIPSPGETPRTLSARLGVSTEDLRPEPTQTMLDAPYAPGTPVSYKFPSAVEANKAATTIGSLSDKAPITVSVKDCVATVKLKDSVDVGGEVSLFANTPLRSGYLQIGTVDKGKSFSTSGFPVGKTSIIAYREGTSLGLKTAIPVSLTVPSSCAELGWTGDARIVNGLLMTDEPVNRPYAYVSIDRGEWQRFPAGQGNFLASGTLNSVTSYLPTTKWDQLDVRVWTYNGAKASEAAAGTFCRKNQPNPDPWSGSGSKGPCQAPGPLPQDDTVNVTKGSLSISASLGDLGAVGDAISGSGLEQAKDVIGDGGYTDDPFSDDPTVSQTVHLGSDLPVKLEAVASNQIKDISYQFSLFPISPNTTSLKPPGVFFTTKAKGTKATVHPYVWRDARLPGTDGDTMGLSFDDALSLELAKANLAAKHNLIDTLYVRAVASDNQCQNECLNNGDTGHFNTTGIASNSVKIDMVDPKKWLQLKPTATIKPGLDTDLPASASRGKCFAVLEYPDKDSYKMFPGSAPYVQKSKMAQIFGGPKVETSIVKNDSYKINPSVSDRSIAIQQWGEDKDLVHCLDPDADKLYSDSVAAYNAKKEAECDFACKASAVLFGFAIGFVTGGPAGAVIGAAAGYYFAYDLKDVTGTLTELIVAYYGLVAAFYNTIRTGIAEGIGKFNPICLAVKAASEDGYSACATVVTVVVQAIITYYTGMPPTLPPSETVMAMAKGKAEVWAAAAVEAGLRQIPGVGSVCDTLTVTEDEAESLALGAGLADELGTNGLKKMITDNKRPDEEGGGISACALLAKAITKGLRDKISTFYSGQVGSAMELPYGFPPGTVTEPVTDTTPEVVIEAKTPLFLTPQPCPVTANVTVLLDGGQDGENVLYTLRPIRTTLSVVPGSGTAKASLRIPVLPSSRAFPPGLLTLAPDYPKTLPKYLNVQVDSPCFKDSKLNFQFDKKGGDHPAFVDDDRDHDFYYTVVK